jgi:MFS family permease
MEKHDRFAALRYPDFRLLYFGQFISFTGSQMQIVALNWHIYLLTHSAFALGLIGLVRFIPIVAFSLFGGTAADAFNRKKVIFVTNIFLTLSSIVLAIATVFGFINPLLIYTMTIASAICMAFEMPARQAFIPTLVDKNKLTNAMSLHAIMMQTSMVLGPSLSGFAIAALGVGSVYIFNAISYLAVITALLFISASGTVDTHDVTMSFESIKEGLSFVKSKTMIWSTMLLDFFSTFFASATALLPIYAKDIINVGPQGLGILYAAPAVGSVLAGFFMTSKSAHRNQGKLLLVSVFFYGLATVIFGVSSYFWLSFLALAAVGAGDGVSAIIRNTIRQIVTPNYIRGRMTSINMIFFMGGPQLGEFEAGLLAGWFGAPLSVVTGGIATMLAVAIVAVTIPALRKYDTHE